MTRQNVDVAVMFADVTGSTKLYETLGDDNANRIIGKVIDVMAKITEMYQGYVIKTIGDEIMCRFTSANDCVRAAKECQEEISMGIQGETVELTIKVGFAFRTSNPYGRRRCVRRRGKCRGANGWHR